MNRMKKTIFIITFSIFITLIYSTVVFAAQSQRFSGSNRYETSLQVSKANWTTSKYACIATGEDFPDALCATPLAKKYNAPIILIDGKNLSREVLAEFKRLGVTNVFIIGGQGVISSNVDKDLRNNNINSVRLFGNDRYQTSIKVAEQIGPINKVILTTGDEFPDAISVSAPAAIKGIPILLTGKDSISEDVKKYINSSNRDVVYGIGGTGVISDNVLKQIKNSKRICGENRIATNLAVINEFIGCFNLNNIYVASAMDFPDGLCGSAAAALSSSPLMLVQDNYINTSVEFIYSKVNNNVNIKILGGVAAIDYKAEQTLLRKTSKLVVIDPGHGGYDPGTIGVAKTKEKDVTLSVALKLGASLKAQGIRVEFTRTDDKVTWPSQEKADLKARCEIANKFNGDLFISIHCNAAGVAAATGTESYSTTIKANDAKLAKILQDNLIDSIKLRDRGVKTANYYVLNNTTMPSVLVELGFSSNANEEKLLSSDAFQKKCAYGLSNGVMEILNR